MKSAFLKGEELAPGERELYLGQIKVVKANLPDCEKGFGLSDSPRQWHLRLHKSLTKLGWQRSSLDAAMWFLWSEDGKTMEGIVVSHVDDLLMGGSPVVIASLLDLVLWKRIALCIAENGSRSTRTTPSPVT